MIWSNLSKKLCPHCGEPLQQQNTHQDSDLECSACTFVIGHERFVSMTQSRRLSNDGRRPDNIQPLLWQYLRAERCPICKNLLQEIAIASIMRCMTATCQFTISKKKFNDILADKNHIAYKFGLEPEYANGARN